MGPSPGNPGLPSGRITQGGVSVPALNTLTRECKYIDNLGSIQWSEFTVYQSL